MSRCRGIHTQRNQRGFTLIEVVLVIVVLAGAGFAFLSFFQQSARSIQDNYGIQTGIQYARECMEHVVTNRRYVLDFASTDATICDSLPTLTGFSRTVTVTPFDNSVNPICPSGLACKTVAVTIGYQGSQVAQLSLMLTNY